MSGAGCLIGRVDDRLSDASPDLRPLRQQLPKATQCFVRPELRSLAPSLCLGDLGIVLGFQQQYDNEA